MVAPQRCPHSPFRSCQSHVSRTFMPFDVSDDFMCEMERRLGLSFPPTFHEGMNRLNGGEVEEWQLYPVRDTSSRKRISRPSNDIIYETNEAREWDEFPKGGVALASNGSGDLIVAMPDATGTAVEDRLYSWSHDTGELTVVASSFESWLAMRDGPASQG